jgi:hypothetical protein
MRATIESIELKKSKKGARGICVCVKTENGDWVRDWIGESAPLGISNRWWAAAGSTKLGWDALASLDAFDLIKTEVDVTLQEGDYGLDITDVTTLNSGVDDPPEPTNENDRNDDDELPF